MKKKISTIVLSVLLGIMTILVLLFAWAICYQDDQFNKTNEAYNKLKEENETLTKANKMMSESYTRLKNKKNVFGDMSKIYFESYDNIVWVATQDYDISMLYGCNAQGCAIFRMDNVTPTEYEGSSEEIITKYKADGFKVSLVTKDGESVQALN